MNIVRIVTVGERDPYFDVEVATDPREWLNILARGDSRAWRPHDWVKTTDEHVVQAAYIVRAFVP